eukprot:s1944_g10.t1
MDMGILLCSLSDQVLLRRLGFRLATSTGSTSPSRTDQEATPSNSSSMTDGSVVPTTREIGQPMDGPFRSVTCFKCDESLVTVSCDRAMPVTQQLSCMLKAAGRAESPCNKVGS